MTFRFPAAFRVLLGALLAVLALPASADIFLLTVDTSALESTTAVIAIQFNPGPSSPAATAVVSGFSGAASAGSEPPLGAVSGSLISGPLTLTNDPGLNLFLQPVTLGTQFTFRVEFAGNVPPPSDGSFFGLSLVDNTTDFNPLLTTDPDGLLVAVNLSPGQEPAFDIRSSVATVSAVPEPGAWALLLAGLVAVAALRRRGRAQTRLSLASSRIH